MHVRPASAGHEKGQSDGESDKSFATEHVIVLLEIWFVEFEEAHGWQEGIAPATGR